MNKGTSHSDSTLTEAEMALATAPPRPVLVNALLHQRLKGAAVKADKKFREFTDESFWPLVGGKPAELRQPEEAAK